MFVIVCIEIKHFCNIEIFQNIEIYYPKIHGNIIKLGLNHPYTRFRIYRNSEPYSANPYMRATRKLGFKPGIIDRRFKSEIRNRPVVFHQLKGTGDFLSI